MEENRPNRKQHAQQKYRQTQHHKGLVRYELQISADAKARFETLATCAAEEMVSPWDPRRRLAKARAQVFDEVTQGIRHEFFALKDQIEALKAEIKTLSPQFFKQKTGHKTPLPEAIRALPDDPKRLKAHLAQFYQDMQIAQREALKYKRLSAQFEALYDVASKQNEALKS
jgi:hypothetical protein